MKIEIEFEEVERLKYKINSLTKDNSELEERLKSVSEVELHNEAVQIAQKMFTLIIEKVYIELGFTYDQYSTKSFAEMEHWLGEKWWESTQLSVELGAYITKDFKGAFLALGIKPNIKN